MCYEYEFDWYEQARIAEKQRRERQSREQTKPQPSKSTEEAKPQRVVKEKDPAPV